MMQPMSGPSATRNEASAWQRPVDKNHDLHMDGSGCMAPEGQAEPGSGSSNDSKRGISPKARDS